MPVHTRTRKPDHKMGLGSSERSLVMLGAIWSPFTHSQADQALLRKAAFEQALVGLSKGWSGLAGLARVAVSSSQCDAGTLTVSRPVRMHRPSKSGG